MSVEIRIRKCEDCGSQDCRLYDGGWMSIHFPHAHTGDVWLCDECFASFEESYKELVKEMRKEG